MQEDTAGCHTVVALLKACAKQKNLSRGIKLHADIVSAGLLKKDLFAGSALINMYAKCGFLAKAREVFDSLPARNIVSWNALLAGYAQNGYSEEALKVFERMQSEAAPADAITYVCTLKACGNLRAVEKGQEIHAEVVRAGLLEKNIYVGNSIIDMYAKCGLLAKAHEVFDKLPEWDVISWTALIAGYSQHGQSEKVLNCFEQMQLEGISPNAVTFACVLKDCGSIGAVHKGEELHAEIVRKGLLEEGNFVGSALVDMYAKCGLLSKAQEVFDKLPIQNVVSWNALITGYVQHGDAVRALFCFEQMQLKGLSPDAVTFVCILKACGSTGAADQGQEIHAEIIREGLLEKDTVLGTALMDMYVKCDLLAKAQEVFHKLPFRDVGMWNVLIAGCAQYAHGEEAMKCFEQMRFEGVPPNTVTFLCILKTVARMEKAQEKLHVEIFEEVLLESGLVIGNGLVDMYADCGELVKAHKVLDKLPEWNVTSWNVLITAYVEHGHGAEALDCFERMKIEGIFPNAVTFVSVLKACGSIGAANKGQQLHVEVILEGLLETDIFVGNVLIDMYCRCGFLVKAQGVFDKLSYRDVVSWSALIRGFSQHGCGQEALNYFERMECDGISPDAAIFVCILKTCGSIGAADKGLEIHCKIMKEGLLEKDMYIGSALVDMYAKCGLFAKAQDVFDKLPFQHVVLWGALIAGYAHYGLGKEALYFFERMQLEGIHPDAVTFVCILKACGCIGAVERGQEIHAEVVMEGLLERDIAVGTALVDMYLKCSFLIHALEVFERLPVRNVVAWNAVIAGYVQHRRGEEALNCFGRMQLEGLSPNEITFISVLNACGSTAAVDNGHKIYTEIVREGLLEKHVSVGNALIDMFAKCGVLAKAQEVFDKLPLRNVVSWHALLTGYALLGKDDHLFVLLDKMVEEGIKPELVTSIIVLSACSHAGLVEKGRLYFEAMSTRYDIFPTLEHYICMVDLFSRAGCLTMAITVIKEMPFSASLEMWHIVLSGCRKLGNVELGRLAFDHAMHLDARDAAAYVYMSNIYADATKQDELIGIEATSLPSLL